MQNLTLPIIYIRTDYYYNIAMHNCNTWNRFLTLICAKMMRVQALAVLGLFLRLQLGELDVFLKRFV